MSPASPIVARDLVKHYGEITAVDGVSFEIAARECFGFLGPNGAGKTTTMRMLYGRIQRTAGDLAVLGLDPARDARRIRDRLGIVPQEDNLDGELTAIDNLIVYGGYFGMSAERARLRARELLEFVELEGRSGSRTHDLSGGMKRRLLVARALINEPELLILDEPTTGLDPQARLVVWERLAELKQRGVTVIVTTHYMEEASRLCDRLVIMDDGKIIETGSPRELIGRHAGDQVLEVRWPLGLEAPELESGDGIRRLERAGDRILFFTPDPAAALVRMRQRLPADAALIRPATLEDVFIHLTGRALREDG